MSFFFEEFRVSGFWIPVAGRAFLKTRAVSTGVFTTSFCVSLNFACFAENTIKIWFQPKQKPQKHKNYKFSKLKNGPSLS